MTICFENETDQELDFDYENILEKVIRQAAEQEKCPYEFEVNVTFTDNDSIREINREFRELDVPTDVLLSRWWIIRHRHTFRSWSRKMLRQSISTRKREN